MKRTFVAVLTLISLISFSQSEKMGNYHLDQNYKIGSNGTITLTASDAKVFITGSNRTDVHVKIDRTIETRGLAWGTSEFSVDVTEAVGDLTIRERSRSNNVVMVGMIHEHYTINIEAPVGVNLNVRGDDGDYFITTINGSIEMDVDDADIELTRCQGTAFKFKVDDGDIKMDEGRGNLIVDADDADIEVANAKFTSIDADMDDGDFLVETTIADGGQYSITSQDGLIALTVLGGGGKFEIRHDDANVSTFGGFEEVEESENRTRLKLGKGTARVDIRADDARVKLAAR